MVAMLTSPSTWGVIGGCAVLVDAAGWSVALTQAGCADVPGFLKYLDRHTLERWPVL